jgi:chaperonin GroES
MSVTVADMAGSVQEAPRTLAAMANAGNQRRSETPPAIETVEPIGKRVLIRKDEDKKVTKGGVHLPDKIEIPTLTGRVVTVSAEVERNADYPIQRYDRVLFNPKHAIPVDFEGDNRLFVVPIEDIVAVFRRA